MKAQIHITPVRYTVWKCLERDISQTVGGSNSQNVGIQKSLLCNESKVHAGSLWLWHSVCAVKVDRNDLCFAAAS